MSHLLTLDPEQAELLQIAAASLAAMAHTRSKKMKDVDFLADSAGLQREKLRNILAQLALPSTPKWSDLKADDRKRIRLAAETLLAALNDEARDRAFATLFAFILQARNAVLPPLVLPNVPTLDI